MKKIEISQSAIDAHRNYFITTTKIIKSLDQCFLNKGDEISKLKKYLLKNINEILLGEPDQLRSIHEEIQKDHQNALKEIKKKDWKKIFNYNNFKNNPDSKWGASQFIKSLNIKACPYCNANYVIRAERSRKNAIKPALDHIIPESQAPYFAISLYNLVPACFVCNSCLKRSKESPFNPYENDFHEEYSFNTVMNITQPVEKIELFHKDKKIKNNEFFEGIEDIYKHHFDYATEILVKAQEYNKDYMQVLQKEFTQLCGLSWEQFYYGNYTNSDDINKRPLSKLTIDILEQIHKK